MLIFREPFVAHDLHACYWADRLRRCVGAGLVGFNPHPITLAARFVGETNSPLVVFMTNLAVATTVVTIFSVRTAAGEEIGWRG